LLTSIAAAQGTAPKINMVGYYPLRLIDLVNPGLEFSYEIRLTENFSTEVSLGLLRDFLKVAPFRAYRGRRFSIEGKYFLLRKAQDNYLSAEAVLLQSHYFSQADFVKDTALQTPRYSDSFQVSKRTIAMNFKYGFQFSLKGVLIDLSIGVGLKYRKVGRSGVLDAGAYEIQSRHPNAYSMANKTGNHITANVPVAVKLAYPF